MKDTIKKALEAKLTAGGMDAADAATHADAIASDLAAEKDREKWFGVILNYMKDAGLGDDKRAAGALYGTANKAAGPDPAAKAKGKAAAGGGGGGGDDKGKGKGGSGDDGGDDGGDRRGRDRDDRRGRDTRRPEPDHRDPHPAPTATPEERGLMLRLLDGLLSRQPASLGASASGHGTGIGEGGSGDGGSGLAKALAGNTTSVKIGAEGNEVTVRPASQFKALRSFSVRKGGRTERVFLAGRGTLDELQEFYGQQVFPADDAADRAENLEVVDHTPARAHTPPAPATASKPNALPYVLAGLALAGLIALAWWLGNRDADAKAEVKTETSTATATAPAQKSDLDKAAEAMALDALKRSATSTSDTTAKGFCKVNEQPLFDEDGNTKLVFTCPDGSQTYHTVYAGSPGPQGVPGTGCTTERSTDPANPGVVIKCGSSQQLVRDGARGPSGRSATSPKATTTATSHDDSGTTTSSTSGWWAKVNGSKIKFEGPSGKAEATKAACSKGGSGRLWKAGWKAWRNVNCD